jgi:hypothetical protein
MHIVVCSHIYSHPPDSLFTLTPHVLVVCSHIFTPSPYTLLTLYLASFFVNASQNPLQGFHEVHTANSQHAHVRSQLQDKLLEVGFHRDNIILVGRGVRFCHTYMCILW